MTPIQALSIDVAAQILKEEYYVSIFEMIQKDHCMYYFDRKSDEELIEFWNDFWMALPDSMAIRRGPFFKICDLCVGDV